MNSSGWFSVLFWFGFCLILFLWLLIVPYGSLFPCVVCNFWLVVVLLCDISEPWVVKLFLRSALGFASVRALSSVLNFMLTFQHESPRTGGVPREEGVVGEVHLSPPCGAGLDLPSFTGTFLLPKPRAVRKLFLLLQTWLVDIFQTFSLISSF